MKKRGTSQIDWILSLSIFLIYIAWFFAIINPQINSNSNKNSIYVVLMDKFEQEFEHVIEKTPLFLESNITAPYTPIILNYTENKSHMRFLDGRDFIIWRNKLIFLEQP